MRFLLAFLVLLFLGLVYCDTECKYAPSSPEDRREDKTKLRLLQFNAEWLFIDEYNGCPGSSCTWENSTVAAEHLDAISSVVAELNPDIVNFCEIEGCDELNDVMANLEGYGYQPYLIFGDDSSTGQDVGILTKIDPTSDLYHTEDRYSYPVEGNTCGATNSGTKGLSKHYATTFSFNGMKIAMIGMHLLAHPDDTSRCNEREAQAMVARGIIEDYWSQGYEIIAIGDLNDYDGDVMDSMSDVPISRTLSILKTGLNGDGNPALNTCGALVPQEELYTEWYDENHDCQEQTNEHSTIDHILLSPNLYGKVSSVEVAHSAYGQGCDSLYSDHWPVIVDFEF